MKNYRLETTDEFPHKPTAEINFNESVYVNGWDSKKKCGGWMRMGNRVNEGYTELQLCFYLPDGRIACQFLRPPISSNENFCANGLEYQVIKPFEEVTMKYAGPLFLLEDPEKLRNPGRFFSESDTVDASIAFRVIGNSPIHGGEPIDENVQTMYGRDFSFGHFFQHTVTKGTVVIDNKRITLTGYGWRDHSWGPRYWTNIFCYRLLIANFGPDHGITLLKLTEENGNVRKSGVLLVDRKYEPIKNLEITTDWSTNYDPIRIQIEVETEKRSVQMEGEVLVLAPLRNRRKLGDVYLESRIAEGFTEWKWDEKKGIGITEYIERIENGRPVGYPQ